MRHYFGQVTLIAVTAIFLTAATSWARSAKTTESGSVNLIYSSRIANGPLLKAGVYKVELASSASTPELMFYQNGKLKGQAPAKLISESKKINQTEIQYNTAGTQHVITEIDVRGWRQGLKFPSSQHAA